MTTQFFTREQAEAQLGDMGFVYIEESAEWWSVFDDTRGRLTWYPDYDRPDEFDIGSVWQLRLPNDADNRIGFITILPTTTEGEES